MVRRSARLIAVVLLLGLFCSSAYGHGLSEADKKSMIEGGYYKYCELGAKHMLTGYDHLLFLFGVMFFLTSARDILKFVTAFTVGHCITLICATFLRLEANYYLIDAVIGFSVCYKGFDNLDGFPRFFDMKSPNLVRAVFLFGLIHGFGLSARLQQLPLGEPSWAMLLRILSFNLGVEVGQVIALSVILIVISKASVRDWWGSFCAICNTGLMVAGFLLVCMQLHGYLHEQSPAAFPLNEHLHAEVHIRILEQENAAREEMRRREELASKENAAKEERQRLLEEERKRQEALMEALQRGHGHSHGS